MLFVVQLITIKSIFLIYFFQIITMKTTTILNTHKANHANHGLITNTCIFL